MADSLAEATARLEAAVERLALAASRPRPASDVRSAEVADLSRRLDAALARLRAALREESDLPPDPADDDDVPITGHGAREA